MPRKVRKGRTPATTVTIPLELAKKAQKHLQEDGYMSLGELVRELLRQWLKEKKEHQ